MGKNLIAGVRFCPSSARRRIWVGFEFCASAENSGSFRVRFLYSLFWVRLGLSRFVGSTVLIFFPQWLLKHFTQNCYFVFVWDANKKPKQSVYNRVTISNKRLHVLRLKLEGTLVKTLLLTSPNRQEPRPHGSVGAGSSRFWGFGSVLSKMWVRVRFYSHL